VVSFFLFISFYLFLSIYFFPFISFDLFLSFFCSCFCVDKGDLCSKLWHVQEQVRNNNCHEQDHKVNGLKAQCSGPVDQFASAVLDSLPPNHMLRNQAGLDGVDREQLRGDLSDRCSKICGEASGLEGVVDKHDLIGR